MSRFTRQSSSNRWVALLIGVFVAVLSPWSLAAPSVIYVGSRGVDNADGASQSSALATLQAAIDRATTAMKAGASDVEIRIGVGRYQGQRAQMEGWPQGKTLAIVGESSSAGGAIFDGAVKGGAWLVLMAKSGDVGNVQIKQLGVSNYVTAISLAGSRDAPTPKVVNVLIQNNVFSRIGQIAVPNGPPSSAAVRIVNGHNVRLIGNRFTEIKNATRCGLLHAIYLAHNSTENTIENNTFEDSCGDAIRFRDGSGNNRVSRNTFVDAWAKAPITDWYCDSEGREDCTKAEVECPSWNNIVEGNQLRSRSKKKPPAATLTYGADDSSACRDRRATTAGASSRFLSR